MRTLTRNVLIWTLPLVAAAALAEGPGSPDLAAAVVRAFQGGGAAALLPHLPEGRSVVIAAPMAGVPEAAYAGRQARAALDRIFSRLRGGRFEIVSGRAAGSILGRWTARTARSPTPKSLAVTITRTGSTIRSIRLEERDGREGK